MNKEKVIEILINDFGWVSIEQRDDLVIEMMQDTIEATKKAFSLTDVVDCLTDKEKIDYQIAQKRKESDDNMKGWLYALFFGLVIIIIGFNVLKRCSS